jgi:single-strand DNA-binding protein
MNKVIEIGRATKDVELRMTPSGASIASFSIAVKRNFKNAEGNYESDFFECVAFNKLAETISRYVHKGDMVGVQGRLQTNTYTDGQGNNRKSTQIIVEEVEFLTTKKAETPAKEEIKKAYADPFEGAHFEELADDEELPF